MPILVTNGIEINVVAKFNVDESDILNERYVYSYTVQITNKNDFAVQLMKRKWHVFDSVGAVNIVKGDGVIGRQPVIEPGESHEYNSWSLLRSEVGQMYGKYLMQKSDGESFWVDIPCFELILPEKLN